MLGLQPSIEFTEGLKFGGPGIFQGKPSPDENPPYNIGKGANDVERQKQERRLDL